MLPTRISLKDGQTVILRPATPDDARATFDLLNTVAAEKGLVMSEGAPFTIEEERTTLERAAGSEHQAVFVAELSGRLVGRMNVDRGRWENNTHVSELGVSCLPDYRGIGLGYALLRRGIEWARGVGVRKLTLRVLATNERAIRLYTRLGFVEEARLKGQVVLDGIYADEILMALWL